jgi:hypothetical protein
MSLLLLLHTHFKIADTLTLQHPNTNFTCPEAHLGVPLHSLSAPTHASNVFFLHTHYTNVTISRIPTFTFHIYIVQLLLHSLQKCFCTHFTSVSTFTSKMSLHTYTSHNCPSHTPHMCPYAHTSQVSQHSLHMYPYAHTSQVSQHSLHKCPRIHTSQVSQYSLHISLPALHKCPHIRKCTYAYFTSASKFTTQVFLHFTKKACSCHIHQLFRHPN